MWSEWCKPNQLQRNKLLCEKNNISFKNQTFTQFIKQIRVKYFDELKEELNFQRNLNNLYWIKVKENAPVAIVK